MTEYAELRSITSQYRILAVLIYAKYHMRKDMPTSALTSFGKGLKNLHELTEQGYIKVVKENYQGVWYNITPKGEKLYKEYVEILENDSPDVLLMSKDDIRNLVEKNRKHAIEASIAVKTRYGLSKNNNREIGEGE